MSAARSLLGAAILATAALAAGCHPTVKAICEDLDDECSELPYQDCLDDGQRLETLVEQRDCSDVFNAYLDCVSDATCGWKTRCESQQKTLEACTGPFP